jgi:hypothetical protein
VKEGYWRQFSSHDDLLDGTCSFGFSIQASTLLKSSVSFLKTLIRCPLTVGHLDLRVHLPPAFSSASSFKMAPSVNPLRDYQSTLTVPFNGPIRISKWALDKLLGTPPRPSKEVGRPKIAIIGAGITGVMAAAHCIGHGFDVVIFEANSQKNLGGIWSVRQILYCASNSFC